MALPASLKGLSTREAITDALYRCIDGFDLPNRELFESSLTKDAVFVINGNRLEGLDAIHKGCYDYIATQLATTHFLSNIRIEVQDGEKEARVTAHAQAQHIRLAEAMTPGAEHYLGGSLYDIVVVKDANDGLWKWKYWDLRVVWGQGNAALVTTEGRAWAESRDS